MTLVETLSADLGGAGRDPGRAGLEFARTWPNQREVAVSGIHYVQEDSPKEIGVALRDFVLGLPNATGGAGA